MDRLDLHEQIEIHRGNETDVSPDVARAVATDPHKAERLAKIQACDAVIGAAVRNVAVPTGLKARIKQQGAVESAAALTRRRRKIMIGGLSSALALSLVVGLSIWRWPEKSWTSAVVANAAMKEYGRRHMLQAPPVDMPPLPRIGLREGIVAGFQEIPFLKKDALAYRLESGGHEALAIVVHSGWFPADFDRSDTYVNTVDGTNLEVRFQPIDSTDQYVILIGEKLKPFEEKTIIL